MQGLVFQVLDACHVHTFGPQARETLVTMADAQTHYSYSDTHADAELGQQAGAIQSAQGMTADASPRWFGEQAMPLFHALAPDPFDRYSARSPFLCSRNDTLHPEVRDHYPGVDVPDFEQPESGGNGRVIAYRTARRMCFLAEGLMQDAAAHFGDNRALMQSNRMHRGDDHCRFEVTLGAA